MSHPRLLVVALCVLVGLVILVWPHNQVQVEYARRGDLELYLKCPYTFQAQVEEITATQIGSVLAFYSEGERVKSGDEICAVRGKSQVSYTAPTGGFVTYLATPGATVNIGTPLAQIMAPQGILKLNLTPEQVRHLTKESELQILFSFSQERIWAELLQIGKEKPGWQAQLSVVDYLPTLNKTPTGVIRIYYGWVRQALLLPLAALSVAQGQLGVYIQDEERIFQPIQLLAAIDGQIAVAGISDMAKVVLP
jgi:hypothetical protein